MSEATPPAGGLTPPMVGHDALSEAIAPAGGFIPPMTGPDASATLILGEARGHRGAAWRWGLGALFSVSGIAVALALHGETPRAPEIAPVVLPIPSPPRSSTVAAAPAPSVRRLNALRVEVAEDVRLVLVNGVRVDARPLLVELEPGQHATLEYIDGDGAMHQRVVGEADHDLRLGGAARRPKPPPASRKAPRPTAAAPRPEGELMDNPYK